MCRLQSRKKDSVLKKEGFTSLFLGVEKIIYVLSIQKVAYNKFQTFWSMRWQLVRFSKKVTIIFGTQTKKPAVGAAG